MKPKYKIGEKLVFIKYFTSNKDEAKDLLEIIPFVIDQIILTKGCVEYYSTRASRAKEEELLTKTKALKQLKIIL